MNEPQWTFSVHIHSTVDRPEDSIDYTPQEESFALDSAAYYLSRALIDFKEFTEAEEASLRERLATKIGEVETKMMWREHGAVVTVTRVR